MSVKGRKTPQERRKAREARRVANAPAPPKVESQVVEIKGSAKVDVDDPTHGAIKTDHQGALGELEGTYYNAERQEHMGRVRVGQRADGTGGQLRGIPLSRLQGVKTNAPVKAERAPSQALHFGPVGVSDERWEAIFGTKTNEQRNLMDEEKAAAAREELQRLSAQINGA